MMEYLTEQVIVKRQILMNEKKQGRRSAKTAQETKRQILEVAVNMFCEHGYEQVSLRNISESAGVSHSLIRHHFGSKEKVWYAASDKVSEYMRSYISLLIEQLNPELPANLRLYQFIVRLMAHFLKEARPIQFAANLVRQDDKFIGYFIDSHGEVEKAFASLIDNFNEQYPNKSLTLWEQKWLLFTSAHAAHSLKPLMKEVWKEETSNHEERLLRHWQIFNKQCALLLCVDEQEMLQPDSLDSLLISNFNCCEDQFD